MKLAKMGHWQRLLDSAFCETEGRTYACFDHHQA